MPSVSFSVNPEYAQITQVVPGLYSCGVSSLTPETMENYAISLIVNTTSEVPNIQALGKIPRIKLWLQDNTLTSVYPILDLETDQIESVISAGGNVLVHSVAGISRSATICLAYLTKFRCKSLREAYHVMSKTRPLVRPNIGFWRQLIAYEQDIKQSKGTVRLIKDKTNFDELIPDVYFSQEIETSKSLEKIDDDDENMYNDQKQKRRQPNGRLKFRPVLEPVIESVEASA